MSGGTGVEVIGGSEPAEVVGVAASAGVGPAALRFELAGADPADGGAVAFGVEDGRETAAAIRAGTLGPQPAMVARTTSASTARDVEQRFPKGEPERTKSVWRV
jgi:hypothetical protein